MYISNLHPPNIILNEHWTVRGPWQPTSNIINACGGGPISNPPPVSIILRFIGPRRSPISASSKNVWRRFCAGGKDDAISISYSLEFRWRNLHRDLRRQLPLRKSLQTGIPPLTAGKSAATPLVIIWSLTNGGR